MSRDIAVPIGNPQALLCDGMPETSLAIKNFPELRAFRDIAFYWKHFLNPGTITNMSV